MKRRRLLSKPRAALAVTVAILSFGVLSSAVGTGALPTTSLPAYGVTNGDGSLSTVALLGDVNGDGYNDYAVGLPSSDVGGVDSGIVYVFLGHAGALPPTPTAINLANASFRIVGHAGEMLGYTIVGNDVNGDALLRHRDRGADGRSARQVRRRRGLRDLRQGQPGRRQHDDALERRPHERPGEPGAADGARQPLRRLPAGLAHGHVAGRAAGRQRRRLPRSRRGRSRRRPAPPRRRRRGRALRQAAGRPHHAERPLGERATRTSSTSTSPSSTTSTSARASRASAT